MTSRCVFTRIWRPLSAVLLLTGCGRITPAGNEPADFNTELFPQKSETVRWEGPDAEGVYREVLRFYRPAGNQVRWLERALLPADNGAPDRDSLTADVATSLVVQAGGGYCLREQIGKCRPGARGGMLRLTPVYFSGQDVARVGVRYTSVDPYAAETSNTQVFRLVRDGSRWRIRSRGPVREDATT
jgi:hypothetical protein